MNPFGEIMLRFESDPWVATAVSLGGLILLVGLSGVVTKLLLVRLIGRAMRGISGPWGQALTAHRVVSRLAHVIPALVVFYGIEWVPGLSPAAGNVVRGVASAYVVLTLALSLANLLDALGEIYEESDRERAHARPIKGYLQVLKIVLGLATTILIVAVLFDRDPLLLFSGLGAMTAVLLLVFKDTLLSLVASVQLSSNDMLRVGDWIEMPQLNADGDVVDISLHTVKVQNWDRTITTIPTWRLISESYKNWRGMFESGGRRIKRVLYVDQASVRFLTDEEADRLSRIALLREYMEAKRTAIETYNRHQSAEGKDPINHRRMTNIGTFRIYGEAYLRAHPSIQQGMTRMVRQLQPGPHGLPLEVYCFTATTNWIEYETIQADLFDHFYAILPEFGLRVFQEPSGEDTRLAFRA